VTEYHPPHSHAAHTTSAPSGASRRAAAPPPRRKVWPWVVLALVLVSILGFVAYTALLGAGVKAVDDARAGGQVAIGETFTYQSGLAIAVSEPKPYRGANQFEVSPGNEAYEVAVTIANGTHDPVSLALISTNATVAGTPADEVVIKDYWWPTLDLAPGQEIKAPFRFQVKAGTTGSLQIAVQNSFNGPVFFTGSL
jgi:hypothetical protein